MGKSAKAWAVVTWGGMKGVEFVDELEAVVTANDKEGDGLVVESGQFGESRLLFEFSTKLSLRSSFPGSIGSVNDE